MGQDTLYQLLLIVVQVAIVAIGGYLISFIQAKVGAENLNKYYNLIRIVVMGVEQTFGAGNGPDKKAEAVQLIKKLIGKKLTDEQANSLVESAVFEMNNILKRNQIGS